MDEEFSRTEDLRKHVLTPMEEEDSELQDSMFADDVSSPFKDQKFIMDQDIKNESPESV